MPDELETAQKAVIEALNDAERQAVVAKFTALNPSWAGAGAWDIIDALDQADASLDAIDPFFEAHPLLAVPGCGYAALALIWSGQPLTPAGVRRLLGFPSPEAAPGE
jgi:hypothetical protein